MLQTTPETPTAKVPAAAEVATKVRGWKKVRGGVSFAEYRQIVRPDMLWGWWTELVALELEAFYVRMVRGQRPKLALMAPPQHGKSWAATDFITWVAGKNPDLKTIFTSYSADLGSRASS
jgi:hypothetical protein